MNKQLLQDNECAHCGSHAPTTLLSTLRYGAAAICESCRINGRVLYRRIPKAEDAQYRVGAAQEKQ